MSKFFLKIIAISIVLLLNICIPQNSFAMDLDDSLHESTPLYSANNKKNRSQNGCFSCCGNSTEELPQKVPPLREVHTRRPYGGKVQSFPLCLYTANVFGLPSVFNSHEIVTYNGQQMTLSEARSIWDNEPKSPEDAKTHSFFKKMEEYAIWVENNRVDLEKWAAENRHPSGPIKAKDPEQVELCNREGDLDQIIHYHGIKMPRRKAKFLNNAEHRYERNKEDKAHQDAITEKRRKDEIEKTRQERLAQLNRQQYKANTGYGQGSTSNLKGQEAEEERVRRAGTEWHARQENARRDAQYEAEKRAREQQLRRQQEEAERYYRAQQNKKY